jgi:hypothetical protein
MARCKGSVRAFACVNRTAGTGLSLQTFNHRSSREVRIMSMRQDMDPARTGGVAKNETPSLIASDKVEGTAVYRSDGDKIGSIENVMIDKRNGKVAYAVLSFGGFLGMGQDYYPLPWSLLTYNENLGGYEVNVSEAQLNAAPKYSSETDWDNPQITQDVYRYYGETPYWM